MYPIYLFYNENTTYDVTINEQATVISWYATGRSAIILSPLMMYMVGTQVRPE